MTRNRRPHIFGVVYLPHREKKYCTLYKGSRGRVTVFDGVGGFVSRVVNSNDITYMAKTSFASSFLVLLNILKDNVELLTQIP